MGCLGNWLDPQKMIDQFVWALSLFLKLKLRSNSLTVYAVEFINGGMIQESILPNTGRSFLGHESEMYHFTVHGVRRSKAQPSLRVLAVYTFGHKNLQTCHWWVNRINASLNMETGRPKNLLVFVHPLSGKGNGCRIGKLWLLYSLVLK
ncbi:hypothetical protein L1049_020525 [Liquidambar formosana]|uniref:Ceramide kinase n=1 Tax=Liquidambar formosana TaxID=63359 RepID=A0AAP0S820_LIQFO